MSMGSYGKVNPMDQDILNRRKKNRKRIIIIAISAIVLVGVVVGAVVGTSVDKDKNPNLDQPAQVSAAIKATCDVTLYPDTCVASILPLANTSSSGKFTPHDVLKLALQVATEELSVVSQRFSVPDGSISDNFMVAAFANCRELIGLAIDHLNDTSSLTSTGDVTSPDTLDDLLTWLSAAGTYQQTCLDDFEESLNSTISNYLTKSSELTSNCLAIVNSFAKVAKKFNFHRRLLTSDDEPMPSWLSRSGRSLLQAPTSSLKPGAVVAKDGSGKYKTINAALNAIPLKSNTRFVIYVKKGVYKENVVITKNMWNVMFIGDGMMSTIVTGNLNVVDGTTTFNSATFAVSGRGFIARDIGFQNTAGAIKHQAVALLSTADQSVFYKCSMDAFQDTLYAHSNRQFYRECTITGTVDFIFGNSAVVFQKCTIVPRLPMSNQQNAITAQGKFDPNQNTGITIQGGTLVASSDLKSSSSIKTYLGRPWKDYSTTIFMNNNFVGNLISPAGWLPWVGNTAPSTIFYVEYKNSGPSSSTTNRVNWKGLKLNLSAKQVSVFTVNSFINGANWLPATSVPFSPGL